MGRILRFTLIGCGGLIGLVVLLSIAGALIGGGGGPPEQGEQGAKEVGEQGEGAGGATPDKEEEDIVEQLEEGAGDEPQGNRGGGQKEQAAGNGGGDKEQAAASGDEGVVFRVTGDPGQQFQGSLALTDTQRSVQGVTPKDFPLKGISDGILSSDIVSGNAQKSQAGNATLTVQVIVDGEVVKKASTSAEYGVAQVTWSASE